MARGKTADVPQAVAVTLPAARRGGRGTPIAPETIASYVDLLKKGETAGDGIEYAGDVEGVDADDKDAVRRKARQRANTAAMRLKKAIVNDEANDYNEPDSIKMATRELPNGHFVFGLSARKNDD